MTPAALRTRMVDHLAVALPGWVQSRQAPGLEATLAVQGGGIQLDTRPQSHRVYSVAVLATAATAGSRQSRRGTVARGTIVTSTVRVHWAYRLRADAAAADYGSALEAQHEILAAVLGTHELPLRLVSARQEAAGDGELVTGEIDLSCTHLTPLE